MVVLGAYYASAQQDIILSKYTYNPMFFNPAYAGSNGWYEGTTQLHYRNQWLGIDGAPTTLLAAGEISLNDERVGLGASISSETIGVDRRVDLGINYAYRIRLETGFLAGGLRAGASLYRSNFSNIEHVQTGDIYDNNNVAYQVFTTGAGLYYNQEQLYIGVSVPSIYAITNAPGKTFKQRHFYLHAGGVIGGNNDDLNLEPSILLKYQKAAPLQITLGANLWYRQKFAIGGHWRSSDAFALSTEFIWNEDTKIGASYDFTYSDLRGESNGTLELLLGYRFFTKSKSERQHREWFGGRF